MKFPILSHLKRHVGWLARQDGGGAAALVALAAPVIVGGLTLSIDIGYLYFTKRTVQQQADSAAIGAAFAKSKGTTAPDQLRQLAARDAARNGYVDTSPNSLTVNVPPASGPYTGNATTVEVIIQSEAKTFFARFFNLTSVTMHARAVAGYNEPTGGGGGCILSLHPTAPQALRFQGSGAITAPTCTVVSNSNAADSVFVGGSETLRALAVRTVGNMAVGPSAYVDLTDGLFAGKGPVPDPYANVSATVPSGCGQNNFSKHGSSSKTIDPGTYCNGMDVGGSGTLYMNSGTYFIKGGDFKVGGTSKIRCGNCYSATDGVTIVLAEGASGSVGSVSIAGTTDVQFAARTDSAAGDMRGVAIYQARNATPGNAANLTGSSNMKISGAIYMPAADINYSGTSDLPLGKSCVEIIGRIIEVQGNSRLSLTDCEAMGVHQISVSGAMPLLLE